MKRAYIICTVRNATEEQQKVIDALADQLKKEGWDVHNPKYDAPQDDKTGIMICNTHKNAMKMADKVFVIWDVNSFGSHFDLGMAFALEKPIELVSSVHPDTEGKSYLKVIKYLQRRSAEVRDFTLPEHPEEWKKLPWGRVLILEESGGFSTMIPELPGCLSQGETLEEAYELLDDAMISWIEASISLGQPIPRPEYYD